MQTSKHHDIEESLLPSSSFAIKPTKRSLSVFTELSYTKRIAIFIILNVIATILTFGSLMRLFFSILTLDASTFVLTYTTGNLLSLIAMVVLTGFKAQLDSITDRSRRRVSAVYLGSMALCVVLPMLSTGLLFRIIVLVLVVVQMGAYYAFTLSYFPRIKNMLGSVLGMLSARL